VPRKVKKKTTPKEKETKETKQEEYLSRFEIARLIGLRAIQIAQGSPILVKLSEEDLKRLNYDPIKIAELEFKEGKLPLKIVRKIPVKPKIKFV